MLLSLVVDQEMPDFHSGYRGKSFSSFKECIQLKVDLLNCVEELRESGDRIKSDKGRRILMNRYMKLRVEVVRQGLIKTFFSFEHE